LPLTHIHPINTRFLHSHGPTVSSTCPLRIRQHTSAYVSIRQHTSAYVSIRQHTSAIYGLILLYMCCMPQGGGCLKYNYVCMYVCMYVYIRMYVGVCVCVCVCVCVYSYMYIHMCSVSLGCVVGMYTYVCRCVCVCVCVFIYVCTYVFGVCRMRGRAAAISVWYL
jgi:nuclear pore complex protein Nup62